MLTNATNVRYQQETAASLIGQTHDTRRWRSEPDLGTSIKFLDRITSYLDRVDICMRKTKVGRRTVVRRDPPPFRAHADMIDSLAFEWWLRHEFGMRRWTSCSSPRAGMSPSLNCPHNSATAES